MEILHHVWELGEASVADVRERMLEYREVAYTTVMTIMKNLYKKGYLTYRKEGVSYIYAPSKSKESVQSNLIKSLVRKVFKGSPSALVQNLLQNEELTEQERREIKEMIEKME
mgnify:CR=1 FL=1